jgi:hypothetical protein
VDCFRYRNKIGLDVALEALREARRGRKCTIDELWRYAKAGRVASVIRPYLEATAWSPQIGLAPPPGQPTSRAISATTLKARARSNAS